MAFVLVSDPDQHSGQRLLFGSFHSERAAGKDRLHQSHLHGPKGGCQNFWGITEKQVRDFLGIEEYKDNLMALDIKMYRRKLCKLSGIEKY